MISISHVLNEAYSARKFRFFVDFIIISVRCCCLFAQNRTIKNIRDIALADLTRDIQQQRLLGNKESRQSFRLAAVAARLVASEDCFATFTHVWRSLSEQGVKLSMTYFTSRYLTSVPLGKDFCTNIIALGAHLLAGNVRNIETYRQDFYADFFTMCEEASRHAAAADLFFSEMLQIKLLVRRSTEMVTIQDLIVASLRVFFRAKSETKSGQAKHVHASRVRLAAVAPARQQPLSKPLHLPYHSHPLLSPLRPLCLSFSSQAVVKLSDLLS